MLLIIAHHHDAEALWLYRTLKEDGVYPVLLLMPEALGIDYSISLHLNNNSSNQLAIFFYTPEVRVEGDQVKYAINRLSYIDPLVWRRADLIEKAYATNEINAFFPALIHSLSCPVSNRIYNGALYGEGGFASKWAENFHRHGVSVDSLATDIPEKIFEKLKGTPTEHVYRLMYFGGEIISPPMQEPLKNHSDLTECILINGGTETLEFILLKRKDGNAELLHVSKTPALSVYGELFKKALFQQLNKSLYDYTYGNTKRDTLAVTR
ncbi:MAG: hypothetical protein JWP44_1014 [Mucilaginibacter sp.]|nr:hypothetical protein [Mucilaginibacter sp.]